MPELKFHYFNLRARGEPARLILTYAGVPFEDVRVASEDWPNKKADSPFGQLPYLEVDGKKLGESWAIYRYLARVTKLDGKDAFEAALLDQDAELFRNWSDAVGKYVLAKQGIVQANVEELYKTAFLPATERWLPVLEKELSRSGTGFFGRAVSWVDFVVADAFDAALAAQPAVLGRYHALAAHAKKVLGLPELQSYLKAHRAS